MHDIFKKQQEGQCGYSWLSKVEEPRGMRSEMKQEDDQVGACRAL